ncbi:MAG TPA: hypothetical protein VFM46_16860 [Pseudomonadales bacterium]|nr:hypothetical protein [Pseudomonadales bacterium]
MLGAAVALSGCVAGSLLVPYPQQVQPALQAVDAGAAPAALETKLNSRGPNELLTHLEQGRLAQIVGQDDLSRKEFDVAIGILAKRDEEARIRVSGVASQGAAVAINDNATRYDGEYYERVFLHCFQALNYAMSGDLEGALVEARRANAQQKAALEAFEKEVLEAKEQARDYPVDSGDSSIQSAYASMDAKVGAVKYSFQVGYAFFISALMYEARGELNDAYIDYKKAYELAPSNSAVLKPLVRLSKQLGFAEENLKWKKMAGDVAPLTAQQGEVVVLYEEGFVPAKHEVSLPFFYSADKIITLAFPIYDVFWERSAPLQFNNTRTEDVTETQALAAKALAEKRLQMITRQLARAYAKGQLQDASAQRNGQAGQFIAQLYSVISERADLRSWLSLPANTQLGRVTLPAGNQVLHLSGAGIANDLPIEVKPGRITLVRVIDTGSRFYTRARVL